MTKAFCTTIAAALLMACKADAQSTECVPAKRPPQSTYSKLVSADHMRPFGALRRLRTGVRSSRSHQPRAYAIRRGASKKPRTTPVTRPHRCAAMLTCGV